MKHCVGLTLVLIALLGGCRRDTPDAPRPPRAAGPTEVPAGDEVTLLGQERDFAKVQLSDGRTGFVRLNRLVMLESGDPGKYLVVETGPMESELPPPPTDPAEPPRPRGVILGEQMSLPAGWITSDGSKLVLAPMNRMIPFRDESSGAWLWPAFVCNAPNCPGRKAKGKPYIFPQGDSKIEVRDGNASYTGPAPGDDVAQAAAAVSAPTGPTCPECLKIRNLASETPREAERYRKLVRRYFPPESVATQIKLEEEYRRFLRSQPRQ